MRWFFNLFRRRPTCKYWYRVECDGSSVECGAETLSELWDLVNANREYIEEGLFASHSAK